MYKKKLRTFNRTLQNRLLSELSSIFQKMMFSKSKFLANIPILDI